MSERPRFSSEGISDRSSDICFSPIKDTDPPYYSGPDSGCALKVKAFTVQMLTLLSRGLARSLAGVQ